jgi:hypothetical protein
MHRISCFQRRYLLIVATVFAATLCNAQVKFTQPNLKRPDDLMVYIGINNYFLIQNSEPSKVLSVKASEGKIERLTDSTFHLFINTASINGIQLSYSRVQNGKLQKKIDYPSIYLTATVPDVSRLRLGTKSNGKISLTELKNVSKVALDDKDFKIKLNYNIQCEITCKPSKSPTKFVISIRNGDLQGNADYQELLGKLSKGDRIRFDKIKVIGNNRTARSLESVTFNIE